MMKTLTLIGLSLGAVFSAQAATVLEGRYEYLTDEQSLEMLGEQVCFFPDDKRAMRAEGDKRDAWFCFSNSQPAAEKLGFSLKRDPNTCGVQGHARVEIDQYQTYKGEGDGNDVAVLTEKLQADTPKPVACE